MPVAFILRDFSWNTVCILMECTQYLPLSSPSSSHNLQDFLQFFCIPLLVEQWCIHAEQPCLQGSSFLSEHVSVKNNKGKLNQVICDHCVISSSDLVSIILAYCILL